MKIADIRKLQQRKHREESGCFVVEGEHLVLELQKAAVHEAYLRASEIYLTRGFAHWQSQLPMNVVSERQMQQISETRSPQGIAAVVPLLQLPEAAPGERAIYLHEIQDPGNLGTILRTLAWFGGFRCLLGPDSVDPYNGKAVRASMGALFHVPVETEVPLEGLTARYSRLACLDLSGHSLATPEFREFDCYLFGNEARGLPREVLARMRVQPFTIAGTESIESLNVAAAVNICQYELHRIEEPA